MIEITEENAQLIVQIAGQEFTRYHFGQHCWKPYLFPIRAVNGLSLLADAPTDHRNHHGFWVGHGRVDDNDFWLERHNSGRIVHTGFLEISSGAEQGSFTAKNDWINVAGETILRDTRTFTFHESPPQARIFDFEIVLEAPNEKAVTLEPTNEAGIPHLRTSEGLTVKTGGTLTNAEGKTNERGTYRVSSPWLDCSGTLGRQTCGIALFNHPDNPVDPTPWFARDYGSFSPNYGFFQGVPLLVTPETGLRLRYRVFVHAGNAQGEKLEGKTSDGSLDAILKAPESLGVVAAEYERYLESVKSHALIMA